MGKPDYRVIAPVSYSFLINGERLFINDDRRPFSKLLADYIDPERTGSITVCVLVSCNVGEVASEWPLRYYMRSRESGSHHEAHVHVRDSAHRYEASVRISDGEVIVGELPRKLAKIAKERILSDQEFFYNCWNTMTDGLSVDINHHYGYIQY